ncbi:hypothetical protein KC363_g250 [Hortaea werneckii]|nr:hypothetical protein KC361_g3779 [Hortaea werneckii]KAI6885667.1 hypothetical protein KC325_g3371 [Hortaea werneckii]KAI6998202.1 hypothetical protein KC359_g2480 [Hortaea werneckii]KAI7147383.1 hypothetical protein KC344_g2812 [Hortaea werneckii]KAI7175972.1 hypothetical protein KC360_g3256 [Hortaea werneckii]
MADDPHLNDLLSGSGVEPKTLSAVRGLADQSRKSEEIRQSLAKLPIQQKLIQIITANLATNPEATLAALRCLGNSCIDNETARSNLSTPSSSSSSNTPEHHDHHLHWAESSLQSPNQEIRWTTVKVLYNLCTDHEESQQQLYRTRGVWYALVHLLVSPETLHQPHPEVNGQEDENGGVTVTPEERTLLLDLLFWITGQKAKIDQQEPPPSQDGRAERDISSPPAAVLAKILLLPYLYNYLSNPSSTTTEAEAEGEENDVDEYATALEITLAFLRDPNIQGEIVRRKWVEGVWRVFLDVEGKLGESERMLEGIGEVGRGESTREMVMMMTIQQQQQQQQLLRPLVSSWTWCLSDIAAQGEFGRVYDLEDPMVREVIGIVQSQGGRVGTASSQGEEAKDEAMTRILTEAMDSTTDRDAVVSSWSILTQSRTRNPSATSSKGLQQHLNLRRLSAACQMLGNLLHALPAETVGAFVLQQHQQEQPNSLHQALWHFLSGEPHPLPSSSSTNPSPNHHQQTQIPQPNPQPKSPAASEQEEAQHSALSLLIQLTRPSSPQIREILGADANAEKALRVLWEGKGKNPGIPQGAVRLVRALGRECAVNQRRFEGLAGRMVEKGLEEQQQQQRESAVGEGGSGDAGVSSGVGEGAAG